ncbi:DUF1868 domain-containing protein [Phormidium pseudopriestleyi FRX01]|uniref:DUF1868 domain-containing protein n=1 Tax=Phormidium pseudopriestleyi FRX01 TaxID=1759528 RepID=A0ABS3FXI1_9CYAN|nr:DUF1868 domain-containing protein [Phormidium pseudopriestleyi]MBO0351816.1 DUF1868 domain-containing protein [Phormidium pseudopriestleyi FRX01]
MDDTLQTYLNRVARMTLKDAYQSGLQHIQPSPKFQAQGGGARKPVSFPGYTVVTPPMIEDVENQEFYKNMESCQQQLLEILEPGLMVPVPADSFHVTLADLIWDGRYRDAAAENPEYDPQLRSAIAQSFQQCHSLAGGPPIRWQALGVMLRTRAIGICLAPKNEPSYEQIVQLRRSIYQNQQLMGLGIEQQYHFTCHITLGYFGEIPSSLDREHLSSVLADFNDKWLDSPQEIVIQRAEIRKFDDMTRYYREEDWPLFKF